MSIEGFGSITTAVTQPKSAETAFSPESTAERFKVGGVVILNQNYTPFDNSLTNSGCNFIITQGTKMEVVSYYMEW